MVLVTVKSAAWAGFVASSIAAMSAASRRPNARALPPAGLSVLVSIIFTLYSFHSGGRTPILTPVLDALLGSVALPNGLLEHLRVR